MLSDRFNDVIRLDEYVALHIASGTLVRILAGFFLY
jgi:hypothetical protein